MEARAVRGAERHGDWSPAGTRTDVMRDASLENRARPSVLPLSSEDANRHVSHSIKLSRTQRFLNKNQSSRRLTHLRKKSPPPRKPERLKRKRSFHLFKCDLRVPERVYMERAATGLKADNTNERHICPARGLSEDVRGNHRRKQNSKNK